MSQLVALGDDPPIENAVWPTFLIHTTIRFGDDCEVSPIMVMLESKIS